MLFLHLVSRLHQLQNNLGNHHRTSSVVVAKVVL
ncbi:hypothetical protein J812_4358, partial [Acinetobacter baumannii 25977_9]